MRRTMQDYTWYKSRRRSCSNLQPHRASHRPFTHSPQLPQLFSDTTHLTMQSSFIALAILAVVGCTTAAPAPGGFHPFSAGAPGNGGNAVSGNSGNANGGSVYTTGTGWGWSPVFVGGGMSPIPYSDLHKAYHILQRPAATAVPRSLALPREVTAGTLASLEATAGTAAMRSRATRATPTAAPSTPRAAASTPALVSLVPYST